MASTIDATKPVFGNPTTASVRANFAAAKAEIEALQTLTWEVGFVDYNDYATGLSALSVAPTTWTKLTNDTLGPNTKTDMLPVGVTTLWNTATNQLDFTDLQINALLAARKDITVTTTAANQVVRIRANLAIGNPVAFSLEATQMQFKTTGTYPLVTNGEFYIGSAATRDNPGEFQIWSDAALTVRVNGWFIRIQQPFA